MSASRTEEKSFPNFCNVKNSGMTFLWPPPHNVAPALQQLSDHRLYGHFGRLAALEKVDTER